MSDAVLELPQDANVTVGDDKPPPVEVVTQEAPSGPSPEEALAEAAKTIAAKDRQIRDVQQAAEHARQEAAAARASQQQDQMAVLAAAVEASTAARETIQSEWQAAMEAGDWAKAATINTKLAEAETRRQRAAADLEILKAGGAVRTDQAPVRQQSSPYSAATQQWISQHPEFSRNTAVRDTLIAKHAELLEDGIRADSPAYFRELSAEYDRVTGKGRQENDMSQDRGNSFSGAPPSRGNQATGGGGSTVQTLLGPVGVSTRNGQTFISIPPAIRQDFEEGAKVSRMTVAEYALEQVKIARERQAGDTGGLITTEGAVFR